MLSKSAREILIVALANAKIGKEVADAIDASTTGISVAVTPLDYDPLTGTISIVEDSNHRFVTDAEKASWNDVGNKVDKAGDTMSGNLIMETTGISGETLTVSSDGMSSSEAMTINITTGNNFSGPSGDIKIETGEVSGSDYAGSIYLTGGDNVDGNPANITLTAGVSSGTGANGSIILNAKNVVYLNQNLNGSISAGPDQLNPKRIENVADPQADQDAATKKWTKDLSIFNNVLYVSTTGSIFTGNGSLFDPYDSIATALAAATDGDLIALLPGTYNEPTVVIPNTLTNINFSGMLSGSTVVTNGFSYTAPTSSINLQFNQINTGQLTIDTTSALNGLIEITRCNFSLDLPYNNNNVLIKSSECSVFGGNIYGAFNASECLFISSIGVYSGLSIFENCKYVAQIEAYGTAIIRMLDCELFGAPVFVNGTTVGVDTPTWQVDLASEYLGAYSGSINKVILANISNALGYTPEDQANKVTDLSSPDNTTYPTTQAVANAVGVTTQSFVDMKEPNGFVNRTDSTISFDYTNREFTISPVTTDYSIYVASVKKTISTSKNIVIPNTTGTYYFYIDSTETLSYTTTFNINLLSDWAYCAFLYWDAGGTGVEKIVTFGDERHGITMDGQMHSYLHTTHGAAFGNGCGLINFTIGAGNINADAQFTSDSGLIWDEDIKFNISTQNQFPILYQSGSTWKKKAADAFPVIYNGTAGYTGTRLAYNLNTAGVWSLAEATNGNYVLIHIFATNDTSNSFIGILGQNEYATGPAAQAAALTEMRSISGLPMSEFCPIGTVIFQTQNGYTNTPKARVIQPTGGGDFVDFRFENVRPGALA